MPDLWGERLTAADLRARVGQVAQIGGLRRVRRMEGVEDGLDVIELRSGGGLELDLLASRGLDLGAAYFHSRPLSWLSAAGFSHPGLREWLPDGFERAFGGGLMTTCGLSNVGAAGQVDGVVYAQHGRASATPAYDLSTSGEWVGDDHLLTVRGKTREAVLYGDCFEKTRTIRAALGQNRVQIEDVIVNVGARPAALLLLYHFNLGWPLVRPETRVQFPSTGQRVVFGEAGDWQGVLPPDPQYAARVTEHDLAPDADGWVRLSVQSPTTSFNLAYQGHLPRFSQWQQFGSGDYVLGLEPGNVGVLGRAAEAAAGPLDFLQPGETRTIRLQVSVEATGERP
ncbi:DUF4432 family protein [Deinococcus sp.]|uniref:DUF4432 family protein n=1 Tax=Deinococcus sp. TaxID=47478 RepID=UPI003CC6A920